MKKIKYFVTHKKTKKKQIKGISNTHTAIQSFRSHGNGFKYFSYLTAKLELLC